MSHLPRISVVVVTHNSASVLSGLIDSLTDGMRGTEWELIVVDNASVDDTPAFVSLAAPQAKLVESGCNAGYASGINLAVDQSVEHDAVLILNPDVRLRPNCAATLYSELTKAGAGLAVPRLHDARGDLINSIRREPTVLRAWGEAVIGAERAGRYAPLGEVVSRPETYAVTQFVDWAEGSTIMMSARCWERCGRWDESFFLYSEETEYALRARDLGFGVLYAPKAQAIHLEGGSDHPALWSILVLNKVRLFRRRKGYLQGVGFWGAQVCREASRAILGRTTSRAAVKALLSPRLLKDSPGPHWL